MSSPPRPRTRGHRILARRVLGRRVPGRRLLSPLAILLVLLALAAGAWNYVAAGRDRVETARLTGIVAQGERVVSTMKDLETGMRGYALSGVEEYLEPYRAALDRIDAERADLDRLEGDGAGTADLRALIEREKAFSARVVATRAAQGLQAATALVLTGEGKRTMDAIRARTQVSQARAAEALRSIARSERRRGPLLSILTLASGLGAVALLLRAAILRRREAGRMQALLDGVLANTPVGLGVLDRGLAIRHLNPALAGMGEASAGAAGGGEPALGAPIWALLPSLRAEFAPLLERARDAGLVTTDHAVSLPSPGAPGGVRYLQMSAFPVRRDAADPLSPIEGVGVASADVTPVRRAELRLRESEATLRTVLDTIPVGILIAEAPSGRIVGHNARVEAILGHGVLPAAAGDPVARWVGFHADGRRVEAAEWPLVAVVREGRHEAELEVDYQRGDGARAWIGFAGAPMHDADGRLVGGVVVVSDIDARKQDELHLAAAKDAAEEANRAKSQFLANMSHELRTPLSAVIGYSEMLQEEMEDLGHESLLVDMRKIESNARHLLGLINDVLDLSKIEAERMEVYAEEFDVADVVRDVAATVEALIDKKGNALVLDLAADLGGARTDVTKLRQCLINLLSNAAKFTENGTVTLTAWREARDGADWLSLAVVDTGIGMNAEQQARLFERFTQADASTTRRFGGTGLGLSITRAFADMLGGGIAVASAEGRGTTFTLSLPARFVEAPAPEDGHDRSLRPAGGAGDGSAGHVLVIDDDPATRDLLSRFLERDGFQVSVATDGQSGLDAARRLRPRCILLDVTMPRMDGWSVLRALRADPELGNTPIIMVTVLDEQNLAFSLGATDYLHKPIRWDELHEAMERFRPAVHEGPVLVIDDDADARERLATLLAREGWDAVPAENGRAGLEALASVRPGLILLDLMMPEMDGFAFLRALRAEPAWRDIPVVVLTAKDVTAEDRRRLAGQADRVLQKGGLGLADLAAALRSLVSPQVTAPEAAPAPPDPAA